jgi:hypothetical protein
MDVCLCGQLANREPQTGQFEVPLASLQRGACSVTLQDVGLSCAIVDDHEAFNTSASRRLASQGWMCWAERLRPPKRFRWQLRFGPTSSSWMSTSAEEERVRLAVRLASETPSTAVILISSHAEDDLAELAASPSVAALVANERRDR